jgi:fatty acid-binding protein DegV
MTIRIVTDSTCDLPESVVQECGITVIPLYVNFGARSYLDGVELSRREFYEMLPESDAFPTTAMPGPPEPRQTARHLRRANRARGTNHPAKAYAYSLRPNG